MAGKRFRFLLVPRRKFERDLPLRVHHEERRERLAGLGNEFVHQITFVFGENFLRLRQLDRLLQNRLADLEFAWFEVQL